jgi:hypothetical protein
MVKFVEEGSEGTQTGSSIAYNNYATYSKVAREGILVGLRRYHFFGMLLKPSHGESQFQVILTPLQVYGPKSGLMSRLLKGISLQWT